MLKKTNVAYNTNGLVKTAILEGSPVEQGYQYDAFGRMTGYFTNINTLTGQLAKYRYNGLGQRIMWQYDVNSNGSLAADEQYFFVHDAKGRVVASMRHTGTGDVVTIQEAFVYHAAGLAGRGGSSLRESAIVRDVDRDVNGAYVWATASDGVLSTRTFYVQNWKGDVMAVLDAEGRPLERVRYTAFGTPSSHPIADVDGNGVVEAADVTAFLTFQGGGANGTVFATTDLNADGLFPDDADIEFFDDEYVRLTNDGATTRTFGMNSMSGVGNREGFGGASWDSPTRGWMIRSGVVESESGDAQSSTGVRLTQYVTLGDTENTIRSGTVGFVHNSCTSSTCSSVGLISSADIDPCGSARSYEACLLCCAGMGSENPGCTNSCNVRFKVVPTIPPRAVALLPLPGESIDVWSDCSQFAGLGCRFIRPLNPSPPIATNGCGSAKWQQIIIGISIIYLPALSDFRDCCTNHDLCYGSCGSTKSSCDSTFLECMLHSCQTLYPGNHPINDINRMTCDLRAYTFYLAVRNGGDVPFCSAQAARCACV